MLICIECNIEYEEDKKFCSYCGGPLAHKEESIPIQKTINKIEEEKSDGKPICPVCKITYEFGNSCIQCGAALVSQIPPQKMEEPKSPNTTEIKKEEPKIATEDEAEEELPQVQPIQEQLIGPPQEKFICPVCKIIYEREKSCIKCGSALVRKIPSQTKEETLLSITPEIKSEKPEDREEVLKTNQIPEVKEKIPLAETPEQQPTKRSTDDSAKRLTLTRKRKINYRRVTFEIGSIMILIVAAGYFLWSTYSSLITKRSEPNTPISKETTIQIPSSSSTSTSPAPIVVEQQDNEKKQTGQSSPISKEVTTAHLPSSSIPITPKAPATEMQEIEEIKNLLEKIRNANLQRDINLFISCYSSDFKNREAKKRATLESWRNFKYLDLSYELKKHSISGNTFKARVEWLGRFSPKIGGRPQRSKTVLDVTFKKEDESWKIKEINPVD